MNHIVFHNDVDGVMSAALFRLYNTENDYQGSRLYPVTSTMRGGQIKKIFKNMPDEDQIAILDFEFNDRANIWIDHHFNPDFGPNPVKNSHIYYDPTAKSAVQLVANAYEFNLAQKETIEMCNMIDSASYPDANFIFESDHPLMILRAFLETTFPADMTFCRVVEMLTTHNGNVDGALKQMGIDSSIIASIRNSARKIDKEMLLFGHCSIVSQRRQNQFPRHAEYLVKPDVEYSVRITLSGPHQKYIQIGFNQWCGKENKMNLGEFMRSLPYVRGGGHFGVAAGTMANGDEQRFLDDVDLHFNRLEDEMEKYAVDHQDPVEKDARELEKTGVDLSDAREQSQKELEKRSDATNEG